MLMTTVTCAAKPRSRFWTMWWNFSHTFWILFVQLQVITSMFKIYSAQPINAVQGSYISNCVIWSTLEQPSISSLHWSDPFNNMVSEIESRNVVYSRFKLSILVLIKKATQLYPFLFDRILPPHPHSKQAQPTTSDICIILELFLNCLKIDTV